MICNPSLFSSPATIRYLMRPQKKTTIATVMKSPMRAFKNVLKRANVSRSVAALANAGSASTVPARTEDPSIFRINMMNELAIWLISKYLNGIGTSLKHNNALGIKYLGARACWRVPDQPHIGSSRHSAPTGAFFRRGHPSSSLQNEQRDTR